MKGFPLMQIKRESEKERLENKLEFLLKQTNALIIDKDYSKVIGFLANAIIVANGLADIEADEE